MQKTIKGDCIKAMNKMEAASIDVSIFSPPYNLGIKYKSYNDDMPRSKYLLWMGRLAWAIKRVLKPDGAVFINVGSTSVDPWLAMDVANEFRQVMTLQNHITWVKSIAIGQDTVGHFKPISSKRFLNHTFESVFHFTQDGKTPIDRLAVGVPYMDKSNLARRGHAQDKRCNGNTWFVPYATVKSKDGKFNHPAGYPVELVERCLKMHGGTNVTVLDPFMGTGTTLVAAKRLGHNGIGIDIDQSYVNTARARLKLTRGKPNETQGISDR